jgi:hypothetical protein
MKHSPRGLPLRERPGREASVRLNFRLIRGRSAPVGIVRSVLAVPGHGRPRPVPDCQQQTWKARWGNPQEFESLILRQCPNQAGC